MLWALIPKRYLYSVAAIAALFVSGLVVYKRHVSGIKDTAFAAGYSRARDSVFVVAIRQRQIIQDSLEAVSARSAKAAQDSSSALVAERRRFDTAEAKRPTGLRLEALPDSFSRVPTTDRIRVIVASTGDTVDDVPLRAAQYWFKTDSLLGLAKTLLDKYAAANAAWSSAWSDEHNARIGADSLVSLYAERLRSQTVPPSVSHAKRDVVYLTLGVIAGAVLHNQFHRTPNSVSTSRSVVVAATRIH